MSIHSQVRASLERLKKIFCLGQLTRAHRDTPQVETSRGHVLKGPVLWPYGYSAYPTQGQGVVLFQGGDQCAGHILLISDQRGAPPLEEGEIALWNKAGAMVKLLGSGKLSIVNPAVGLKEILDELIDLIEGLEVLADGTGATAGTYPVTGTISVNPALKPKLEALKKKTAQLLEDKNV